MKTATRLYKYDVMSVLANRKLKILTTEQRKLEAPVISISGSKVRWDLITNAPSYEVWHVGLNSDRVLGTTRNNYFDLSSYITESGTYYIVVYSLPDDNSDYLGSNASNRVNYVLEPDCDHDYTYDTYVVKPTCQTKGYTLNYCRCGDYTYSNFTNKIDHNYVEQTDKTVAATCDKIGTKYLKCSMCNDEKTEDIPKLNHDWKAATCTTPKTCSECGATKGEALGHDDTDACPSYVNTATCTESGNEYYRWGCPRCGEWVIVGEITETEALGHKLTGAPTLIKTITSPTCTEAGWGLWEGECANCGELVTVEEDIPKLNHDWKDATCNAPKTCSGCGATEGSNNPNNHNYVGDYCSYCGGKKTGGSIGGCVFAGTQIALDADTSIDIADFVGGTPIDFCNPSTLEHAPQQTLTRFFYTKATKKVVLTLEDGKTIEVTPNHVVLTEEGFKTYLDNHDYLKYKVGDKLATVDGYKELVSIQEEEVPETTVYNIATENSLMVANGIIVAGELNYNTETIVLGGNTSKELN